MSHRLPKAAAGMALVLVLAGCSSSSVTPSPVVTPAPPTVAPATVAPATVAPATVAPATVAPATAAPCAGTFTGSVVVIPKQMNNAYFDIAYKGIKDAACALGGTVTEVGPSAADPTLQIPFIQTAITQGAKAIIVSADGADAVAPALKQAMAAGIKVVGVDSSPAVGAYNVFVNQADTAGVGKGLADMACDEAPSCTGEVAVLSAAQTATNQNAWIAAMQTTLKTSKYANLTFDGVYYGNDDPQISTTQAQAMLAAHPNLKVIIAPTTVGIVAAAQVITSQNLVGKVFVGGLGFPKAMQTFVKSGVAPEFGLWNVSDLGYLAYAVAVGLVDGTIKGTVGDTFSVPSYPTLNGGQPYTIGTDSVVVLGPVFMFTPANIDAMATLFGM